MMRCSSGVAGREACGPLEVCVVPLMFLLLGSGSAGAWGWVGLGLPGD